MEILHQKENSKVKKPWGKKRIILFSALGVFLLVAFIAGKYIYDITVNRGNLFETGYIEPSAPIPSEKPAPVQSPSFTPTVPAPVTTTPVPEPTPDEEAILLSQADIEFMQNRVNILVLGVDESTEREHWGSFRTDTMILVSVNFETNDVDMVSIPRDSYVKIANDGGKPTGSFAKVNSAFTSGGGAQKNGYGYAMGTISYLMGGIPVNYYVGFNMNVVKDVVNAMGGVDYDVDIEIKMNGRELHTGMQHLDGQGVLDYCRQRKSDSDLMRIDRQQRMLKAIFAQLKNTGQIVNIPAIYQAVQANMQTNLSFTQISALALMALHMEQDQLNSHALSAQSLMVRSRSCIALNARNIEEFVKNVYGIDVRVDSDINFGSIKARIEAERALIATELNAAQAAMREADRLLAYRDYLSADEIGQLTSARANLQAAFDAEEKDELDAHTPVLQQWNAHVSGQLRTRGISLDASQSNSSADVPIVETPLPTEEGASFPVDEIPYIPEIPVG